MEELPALTTAKYDQLASFVIVRIQFTCFHMDSNQGDKKNSDVLLRSRSLKNDGFLNQEHIG